MDQFENRPQDTDSSTNNTFDNMNASGSDSFNYYQPTSAAAPEVTHSENVVAGIVGSFLLALVGGVLYFIVYQIGYIAGICGLVTVILANFGYQKFAGVKASMKGVIISVIISVIVIFLGEYIGLSYQIFNAYKDEYYITFFDAVRVTPSFLTDPEILPSVIKDLAIAYVLGGVASFSTIRQNIGANRKGN